MLKDVRRCDVMVVRYWTCNQEVTGSISICSNFHFHVTTLDKLFTHICDMSDAMMKYL